MYAAIHIWSDIIFVLSQLSQHLSDSAEHHKCALKKLLHYVKLIINFNIVYEFNESQVMLKDSDFNYTLNKQNWKSILEHVYILKEESVFWASWKQKSVVTSITKTEYITMSMCVKTKIWLTQMLRNINISKYLKDNSYCVSIKEDKTHQTVLFLQFKTDN